MQETFFSPQHLPLAVSQVPDQQQSALDLQGPWPKSAQHLDDEQLPLQQSVEPEQVSESCLQHLPEPAPQPPLQHSLPAEQVAAKLLQHSPPVQVPSQQSAVPEQAWPVAAQHLYE